MHVLLIEDEIRLAESIAQILNENNITCDMKHDGISGLSTAMNGNYDVIIMDVMLPSLDGFEIIQRLRANKNDTPVIFLTAKDSIEDKVTGLTIGADDYLTKPFEPQELLARIKVLARRKGEIISDELNFEDIILDLSNRILICKEKQVHLALKEFELFQLFMSYPNQTFSKDQIITQIWGNDSNALDNNVEAYISFLRKKLIYLNSKVTVKTVRKVGYYLGMKDD